MTIVLLLLLPASAQAWWNSDWPYRKSIILDTTPAGADIASSTLNVPVLLRLHTGNFSYFADIKAGGADLRFMSGDDKTPIKYHIEKFDQINEMALIWLQLPQLQGVTNTQHILMYYGNADAVAANTPRGSGDSELLLSYQFGGPAKAEDASAYSIQPAVKELTVNPASLVADGARLEGGRLVIPANPAVQLTGPAGFTLSAWVKPDQLDQTGLLLRLDDEQAGHVSVVLSGALLKLESTFNAVASEATATSPISLGGWHQLVLVGDQSGLTLYLDAAPVAKLPLPLNDLVFTPTLTIGGSGEDPASAGVMMEVDEVSLARLGRNGDWVKAAFASVTPAATMITLGDDESEDAEGGGGEASHMVYIAGEVDAAGWIVIVICAFMALGAGIVIVAKGFTLARSRKATTAFIDAFNQAGGVHSDDHAQVNPNFNPFIQSPLFELYSAGLGEVRLRMGSSVGAQAVGLSDRSLLAVRSNMNSVLVRQLQKLNSMMVLLTIAISGGPFLGLLGTVVGIMLTFAGIAASGEVDINTIAPGMAAALLATVAGLAVAIPALFGYNYLAAMIKELSADMQVFIEELNGRFTEAYGA